MEEYFKQSYVESDLGKGQEGARRLESTDICLI